MQVQTASHPTVGADSTDDSIGFDHLDISYLFFRLRFMRVNCMMSSGVFPCSSNHSRLGFNAPVGQTPTHWPQKTQVDSGRLCPKKVSMLVSNPRPLKLMA
jgi:hypothetical protein